MIAAHPTTRMVSGVPTQLMTTASASGNPGGRCVQYFPYLEPFTDTNGDTFWQSGEAR